MEFKFVFDENSPCYDKMNDDVNLMVVKYRAMYLCDLLKAKGYLYMNEIYEQFGVKWNPEGNNPCFIYDEHRSLKFRYDVCGSNRSGYEIIVRYS